MLALLLGIVDRMGAKVTWIETHHIGWKCIVTGIELPPHMGIGRTPIEALAEVLRMAAHLGHGQT